MISPTDNFSVRPASHMAAYAKCIGILTATRWEVNAVRRAFSVEEERSIHGTRCVVGHRRDCRLFLFQTGIGVQSASNATHHALSALQLDLLISTGFACALADSAVGDLLIGTDVVPYGRGDVGFPEDRIFRCAPEVSALAMQVARSTGLPAHEGRLATVSRVLSRASEKRAVAERTAAIAADMESIGICAAAESRHIPVLVARAASDLLNEDLPLDFNYFLGRAGWIRGTAHLLANPGSFRGLNRMRRQGKVGGERLTGFFVNFLDALH